ncbi:MAG: hypothetical protein J0L58_01270 [Burkholderiales bacterium]|nr:hypothetical protein [Burkholderiales bacterium]
MLKGLALTPPIVGRISIGKVIEKAGKRLPEKDDEFTVTSQVQHKGTWVLHPLNEALRAQAPNAKLRAIPVRLLFDSADLNLRANYTLFDRATGRPHCVGDGESCKRATANGIETLPCPTPDGCAYAEKGCKPFGRLNVRIGDEDELGSFVFRTTGFNSIRTLATRLKYFEAVSGGHLATIPLELRLRGKSTTQSHRAPIYYVDLTIRTGLTMSEAISKAVQEAQERKAAGFDQSLLDEAARSGFAQGAFEESAEEGAQLVEEFFPLKVDGEGDSLPEEQGSLSARLKAKALVADAKEKVPAVMAGSGAP